MRHVSDGIYSLLMSQGLARGTGATVGPRENKGPALSTMASSGGVKADAGEEKPHRPIGPHTGGGRRDQSGMGEKAGATKAPAVNREVGNRQHRTGNEIVGDPFLRLVANNVDVVPTRQRRGQVRLSLVRT